MLRKLMNFEGNERLGGHYGLYWAVGHMVYWTGVTMFYWGGYLAVQEPPEAAGLLFFFMGTVTMLTGFSFGSRGTILWDRAQAEKRHAARGKK